MVHGDFVDHIHSLCGLCRSGTQFMGTLYVIYLVHGDSVSHRHGSWGL